MCGPLVSRVSGAPGRSPHDHVGPKAFRSGEGRRQTRQCQELTVDSTASKRQRERIELPSENSNKVFLIEAVEGAGKRVLVVGNYKRE